MQSLGVGRWPPRCGTFGRYAKMDSVLARSRSARSTHEGHQVVAFDLNALADLSPLLLAVGWRSARETFGPSAAPAPHSAYIPSARSVLPCILQPEEVALMVRLFTDEGLVGNPRSTPEGRAQRLLRQTTTRPMNVAEIVEHWQSVTESCQLRWSLQQKVSRESLQQQLKQAWDQNLELLSSGGRSQHLAHVEAPQQPAPAAETRRAAETEGPEPATNSNIQVPAAEAEAVASMVSTSGRPPTAGWECLKDVKPYHAAVEAVRAAAVAASSGGQEGAAIHRHGVGSCTSRIAIMSDLPPGLTAAVMSHLRLSGLGIPVMSGSWWEGLPLLAAGAELGPSAGGVVGDETSGVAEPRAGQGVHKEPAVQPSSAPASYSIVSGGIARLETATKLLNARARSSSHDGASSASGQKGQARLLPSQLYLAEWACPVISMHARALSHGPSLGLLSEHELARVMGVDNVDVVMDGIAWR